MGTGSGPRRSYLVTGAASGLGAATARYLASEGMPVVLADLEGETARQLAAQLGDACRGVTMDVTSEADVLAGLKEASELAPLHGVIHCAGILAAGRVVSKQGPHDLAAFQKAIEINLTGSFNVLRLAAAHLQQNEPDAEGERGVVVLTSSVAAFEGQIGQIAYSAAKGGVASMVLPAARELGKFGIRVVAVAPGVFETPMMQAAPDAVRESLIAQAVFPHRLGKPHEFAEFVWQICHNRMLNGSVLRLDGAMRMQAK